jgi:hypothetical protein
LLYAEVLVAVAVALATGHGRLSSGPAAGPVMPGMAMTGRGHAWIMWAVIVLALGCAANTTTLRSRGGGIAVTAVGLLLGGAGVVLSGTGVLS